MKAVKFLVLISILLFLSVENGISEEKEYDVNYIKNMWIKKDYDSLDSYSKKLLSINEKDIVGLLISIDLNVISNKDLSKIDNYQELLFKQNRILRKNSTIRSLRCYRNGIKALLYANKEDQIEIRKYWIEYFNDLPPSYSLILNIFGEKKHVNEDRVDIGSLWIKRKDDELLNIAKQDAYIDSIVYLLVNLDLMIANGITIEKLEKEFNRIAELLQKNKDLFQSYLNDAKGFLFDYRKNIISIKKNEMTIDMMIKRWNRRKDIPNAIYLAESILTCKNKKVKEEKRLKIPENYLSSKSEILNELLQTKLPSRSLKDIPVDAAIKYILRSIDRKGSFDNESMLRSRALDIKFLNKSFENSESILKVVETDGMTVRDFFYYIENNSNYLFDFCYLDEIDKKNNLPDSFIMLPKDYKRQPCDDILVKYIPKSLKIERLPDNKYKYTINGLVRGKHDTDEYYSKRISNVYLGSNHPKKNMGDTITMKEEYEIHTEDVCPFEDVKIDLDADKIEFINTYGIVHFKNSLELINELGGLFPTWEEMVIRDSKSSDFKKDLYGLVLKENLKFNNRMRMGSLKIIKSKRSWGKKAKITFFHELYSGQYDVYEMIVSKKGNEIAFELKMKESNINEVNVKERKKEDKQNIKYEKGKEGYLNFNEASGDHGITAMRIFNKSDKYIWEDVENIFGSYHPVVIDIDRDGIDEIVVIIGDHGMPSLFVFTRAQSSGVFPLSQIRQSFRKTHV
ncbi:MAG: hypothetical protein KAI43_04420 [Candidatus Aureabacteria bacterium]|nr:hypothetical protein [Candidatus Auribacterota bacterium]